MKVGDLIRASDNTIGIIVKIDDQSDDSLETWCWISWIIWAGGQPASPNEMCRLWDYALYTVNTNFKKINL